MKMKEELASWGETHYMVVEAITEAMNQDEDKIPPRLIGLYGIGGRWELAEELTNKFESMNKDREWDGEFLDEIEDFISNQFSLENKNK